MCVPWEPMASGSSRDGTWGILLEPQLLRMVKTPQHPCAFCAVAALHVFAGGSKLAPLLWQPWLAGRGTDQRPRPRDCNSEALHFGSKLSRHRQGVQGRPAPGPRGCLQGRGSSVSAEPSGAGPGPIGSAPRPQAASGATRLLPASSPALTGALEVPLRREGP